jgi:prevent-host-death family protein
MTKVVNIHYAKTHLSRLVEEARAGQDIVIAKAGKPCVRLSQVETAGERKPGTSAHLKFNMDHFFDPLPEDELNAWQQ